MDGSPQQHRRQLPGSRLVQRHDVRPRARHVRHARWISVKLQQQQLQSDHDKLQVLRSDCHGAGEWNTGEPMDGTGDGRYRCTCVVLERYEFGTGTGCDEKSCSDRAYETQKVDDGDSDLL